jgi:hypothetical protein
MTGVRFPAGVDKQFFFIRHRVRTGSVAHQAFCAMHSAALSLVGKTAEAWSWPPTSTKRRSYECVEVFPHSPIRLHNAVFSHRDNFTNILPYRLKRIWNGIHLIFLYLNVGTACANSRLNTCSVDPKICIFVNISISNYSVIYIMRLQDVKHEEIQI